MNGEIISMSVFAQWANFWSILLQKLKNETIGWSVSQSVKNVNKMCFCASFRVSNFTTLSKNALFCWSWFPQVVQKQTLGEVGKYIKIW